MSGWELVVQPSFACLREVRRFVDDVARAVRYDERTTHLLTVAVNEAVANAIEHGGAFRSSVRVTARVDSDGVVFGVSDPGQPFALDRVARAGYQRRGRGLTLMRAYADEISLHLRPDGKEVRMTRRLAQSGELDAG